MKNKKIFLTIFGVFIICVGIFCYFTFHQEEGFRIIKLIDFAGKVEIKRKDVGILDPYNDLRLIADDKVQTYDESKAYFSLDSDKYIYCQENSLVQIDSVGSEKNSRTKITLLKGNELNEIQNPLSSKSKYNVETPNSIMSVRGTVFKVSVKYDKNGESYATLNVYEGAVKTELVFPDGTISDPIVVKKGYAVDTHGTDKLSEYIISKNSVEENNFVYPIDYKKLSKQELESLLEVYAHNKKQLSISKEEIQKLLKEKTKTKEDTKYTVNFYNQDELLETQVTDEINYPNPNRKGYTFDGWYEDSNLTIKNESSTVTSDLNLYGKWTSKNYKISFDSQGGNILEPKNVTYDQEYGELPTPIRPGYTFNGWYLNDTSITSQSKVQIVRDSTLKASWKANEHTAYQVNHYQENLDNNDYTLIESQRLEGRTDSQVSPLTYIYDGFQSPSKKEVVIQGDGSTVVNYYYQRNSLALTIDGDEGIASTSGQGSYRYGQSTLFNVEVKDGYTFDHFEINNEPTENHFTMLKDTKVKAFTKRNTYTISYELNGGTTNNLKNTYTVLDEYQLPIPKKKGYTFSGWNDGTQTNPLKDMKLKKGTTGNKTYTAYWVANTYKISFDTDSGNEIKDKTVSYDSTYGQLDIPTKQGYTFIGWYLNDKQITEKTTVDITSDITLKAKWQANTNTPYKVKYVIESLDNSQDYQEYQTIEATGTTDEKINPKAIDITGFTPVKVEDTKIKGDGSTVCLYKYSRNTYKVSLKTDKGIKEVKNVGTFKYGKEITVSVILKEGYQIDSWNYPENSTNKTNSLTFNVPAQDLNLEVKTKPINYSITYELNGGSVEATLLDKYTVESEFTLPQLTKTGYTFIGWTLEGSNEQPNNAYKVNKGTTGDLKFIAQFEPISYKITYNEATMADTCPNSYTIEDEIELPSPNEKTGYTFTGWKLNDSDIPNKSYKIEKGSTGDKNFTACWQANTYIITFNFDGGSLSSSTTKEVTYGQKYGELPIPKRAGYTFIGWYLENKKIETETSVNITQNETVYAHWNANTDTKYTVYYWQEALDLDQQNLSEEDKIVDQIKYKLAEEITLTGTTDTKVTPEVKSYEGFESPNAKEITIDGDGSSNCHYYYRRNSYNVTLNSKRRDADTTKDSGVEQLTGSGTGKFGSKITLSATLKPGYEIVRWESNAANVKLVGTESSKEITVPAQDTTVTVVTKPIDYTIKFDTGLISSCDGLTNENIKFNYEDASLNLPKLTNETNGCDFAGWYYGNQKIASKDELINNVLNNLNSNTREVTLTAKWKKTYKIICKLEQPNDSFVTYELENVEGFLGENVKNASEVAEDDQTKFEGYDIPENQPTILNEATEEITYTFKLKAYTVTFKKDDHISKEKYTNISNNKTEDLAFDENKTAKVEFKHGQKIKLNAVIEKGYELDSFSTSSDISVQSAEEAKSVFDKGTEIYAESAEWTITKASTYELRTKEKTYKITCDANGGDFGEDSNGNIIKSIGYDYTINYPVVQLSHPQRDGYEFKGYSLSQQGSEQLYTEVSSGSTGDLVFYAQWEKIGGDSSISEHTIYLRCERDYNDERMNVSSILMRELKKFKSNDAPFEIELTSNHQHGDRKIIKWRRYYNDTYVEYDKDVVVTIDPSNETSDIYFIAIYED